MAKSTNAAEMALEKLGLDWGDLNEAEQQTLTTWYSALEQGVLTTEKVKDYISAMKDAVEFELEDTDEFEYYFFGLFKRVNRKCILLKARLRNYRLLGAFLSAPEIAKKKIEESISTIAVNSAVG